MYRRGHEFGISWFTNRSLCNVEESYSSNLIFYYIPLYLTDMEQVSNIMQCIKHLSYHTLITNEN